MSHAAEWAAIACGIGTFLLRLLPMWGWVPRNDTDESTRASAQEVLNSIGPAAITALLVVSLWPGADQGLNQPAMLATVVGLCTVMGAKSALGGIAVPTLLGAAAYGAFLWLA